MAILSEIELYLDSSYGKDEKTGFIFKSRCICNFLERKLAARAFKTTFSRINIYCNKQSGIEEAKQLAGEPFLEVRISYAMPVVANLDQESLQKHYSKIILLGLQAANKVMPIPNEFCAEVLNEFKQAGFRNSWIHAEKSWEKYGCKSIIQADLTTETFALNQNILRNEHPLVKKQIAETKPREALFYPLLGKLKLELGRFLVFETKAGEMISRFDLHTNSWVDNRSDPGAS